MVDIEQNGAYSNIALNKALQENQFSKVDANLLTELVYGVTQRRLTLDYLLEPYITKKIPLWLRTNLRLGVFQLLFLSKIPEYAILNEASEIARLKAGQGIVNFVNGVLRQITRHGKERLDSLYHATLTRETVSLATSLPLWLVDFFLKRFTLEEVYRLGQSLLSKPALVVRTYQRDEHYQALSKQFACQKSKLSPVSIRISGGNVVETDLFINGEITIQDETSSLVGLIGQVKATDIVLDACAAPGGKTTHIASFLDKDKGGKVIALDIHEHKIELIKDNAKRLKVEDVVETKQLDAQEVSNAFASDMFDVAFVDAPCSGLGLMRRKPDIKYSKVTDTITQLTQIQKDILNSVAPCVKVNGRLIYSTCTLSREENEKTITAFLNTHDNYQRESLQWLNLPENCYNEQNAIEIFPHDYQTDGFYICALKRTR